MAMMEDILTKHKAGFSDYTELRGHRKSICCVSYENNSLNTQMDEHSFGVCARTFRHGAYGFAAFPEYNDAAARRVLESARVNADVLAHSTKRLLPPVPETENGSVMRQFNYRYVRAFELEKLAREIGEYAESRKPGVHASVTVLNSVTEKLLVISNGYDYHNIENLPSIEITLRYTGADGRELSSTQDWNPRCMLSEIADDPSRAFKVADDLIDDLKEAEAKGDEEMVYADGGEWDCILMPSFTGMLAHEAVGHTMEADSVLIPGSAGEKYLGKQVASPLVSLTDFHAQTCNGIPGLLDIPVDDEGVKCIDAPIIKDGILVGAMTDRRSAVELGLPMTGNARASEYLDTTIIRMRNTCFHPGESSLDDMIASIDRGYFLKSSGGGNGSLKGEFSMLAQEIYEIRNGKVSRKVYPTTVAGLAWDALKTVTMVSREFEMEKYCGTCGKDDQGIHTASGGAAFKMRLNFAGR